VEDFAMRLTSVVNQLATLGDPEPDDKVVEKYLRVARPMFSQLVLSIETLLDISTLSLEEITERLKAAEDYQPPPSSQNTDGKLYLTEEEWLECHKKEHLTEEEWLECHKKEQEAKRSGAGSSGRNKRRGRKGCTGGSSDGSTYRRLFGPSIIFER
jgi:hypothetical protein